MTFQACLIVNPVFSLLLGDEVTEQKISNAVIWDCKSASGRKGIQDVPKHAAEQMEVKGDNMPQIDVIGQSKED
ncbi:hypothetical protein F2P79_022655 [Pimephales promelas]|nr:hypothetical protein F2P79_022655 [Pimephales promelas]